MCSVLHDIAGAGQHGHSAMLDFHYSTAVEFLRITIAGQPCRVPKAQWSLNTSVTKMTIR